MALQIIICLVLGYIVGSFSTGYIMGLMNHVDIREMGSGNAGTTNAFRTLGKKAGIITLIGDLLKAILVVLLIRFVIYKDIDYVKLLELICGFGCVLGHNFPVWLKFHGGKGIAVTAGVFIAIDPWILPVGLPLFAILVLTTKYVSVGSLAVLTLFPIWNAIRFTSEPYYAWIVIVSCMYTVMAFIQHRQNIKRLMNGTENKIGHKKNTEVSA
ncbi:MAG: glycerol-3-phosphate 1-O-acyltransferase PlsY [Lachnospiraceae bacterium]|nr:glycerol-3-phosphate 1-O-acyltransferase PlsY [Lachnospiraceae bacterium]MBR4145815.1 glycerol-3-phosphate 1-O-acyltransferase PlsY [Lachnospiraceae bacterium]MBR4776315.1 glycerol-3-phosphate 1-O-acyltransferase PlsY [Lachnospiraceae bacterium]MBR6475992.1 glycerol-3-phosphate 1-O-acyltransferase PlsY [Lachnospiraceae bacterium]